MVLLDNPIEKRSFSNWSMGFKQISGHDWSELEGYLDLGNTKKLSKIINYSNTEVIALIESFKDVNQLRI